MGRKRKISEKFSYLPIAYSHYMNQDNLKTGYDMVVIARQTAKGQNYHTIESAFLHLIDLHHLKKS